MRAVPHLYANCKVISQSHRTWHRPYATANATTLFVNCSGKEVLTSVGAAIKAVPHYRSDGPNTINVGR